MDDPLGGGESDQLLEEFEISLLSTLQHIPSFARQASSTKF
jgi:hypothetical protein